MPHSDFGGRRLAVVGASVFALMVSMTVSGTVPGILPAYAADSGQAPAAPTPPRKEFVEIFNVARDLATQKKYVEALAKLAEADALPNQTPFELGLIDQLRVISALEIDDIPTAIKGLDGLPATVTPEQRARYYAKIALHFYNAKDYPNAIDWAKQYLAIGGPESAHIETLLGRAYYFAKDYPNALQSALSSLEKEEAAGTIPVENELAIIAEVSLKLKDQEHYGLGLEKLATYYPKAEYWDDLINEVIDHPTFPREKRALDVFRLMYFTGAMTTQPSHFSDYAYAALSAGFPAEAKMSLDASPDAGKATPLRAQVHKEYDVDQKTLAKAEADALKATSGEVLFKLGVDYYGYSQYDKAIALIQQAIAKGGLKSVDDANLDLGIVYLAAGQKDQAIEAFKLVTKTGGPAELAGLWLVKAKNGK